MYTALRRAVSDQSDIIILNSDVELFPGALREMRAVALLDHMIWICESPLEQRHYLLTAFCGNSSPSLTAGILRRFLLSKGAPAEI